MTLNMSAADAIVAVLLGIVGSALWVWLARFIPQAYETFLAWLATTSMNAAMRRMKKLQLEQGILHHFKENPSDYHAHMIVLQSYIQFIGISLLFCLFVFLGAAILRGQIDVLEALGGDLSKYTFTKSTLFVVLLSFWSAIAALCAGLMIGQARLRRLHNIDARSRAIQIEFLSLKKKVERLSDRTTSDS